MYPFSSIQFPISVIENIHVTCIIYNPKKLKCFFSVHLYRESYVSAPVLLIVLNKIGKSDKMRGLSSILCCFATSHKFHYTGARMIYYIYHTTFNLLQIAFLA